MVVVFGCLWGFFPLNFSANFMQCSNPVLYEEKVYISMDAKLLDTQSLECIKDETFGILIIFLDRHKKLKQHKSNFCLQYPSPYL